MKIVLAALVSSVALMGAAHAADAVVYDVPDPVAPVVPEVYNWTGWYIGAFGGIGAGDIDFDAAGGGTTGSLDISGSGAIGGGQIGADYQMGNWVFGAVADIAATNFGGEVTTTGGFGTGYAESRLDYLGTVRGRIGYAFDRTLFYGHGGWAYGQVENTVSAGGTTLFSGEEHRNGYTVGLGVEHAFTDRLSFQTEYSYVDLGDDEVFNNGALAVNEDVRFHTIKAAINFRF